MLVSECFLFLSDGILGYRSLALDYVFVSRLFLIKSLRSLMWAWSV